MHSGQRILPVREALPEGAPIILQQTLMRGIPVYLVTRISAACKQCWCPSYMPVDLITRSSAALGASDEQRHLLQLQDRQCPSSHHRK